MNRRNGYRHRDLDTRLGTLDVAVPKLREGGFFPDWLLARQRRSEQALVSVVATCYLLDPKGTGQTRWVTRWKPALNAFAITFADRMPAAEDH